MTLQRRIPGERPEGRPGGWRKGAQRPPWTDEAAVRNNCTSCGACISACPEKILLVGPAGTPALDFNRGACTFCGACAEACEDAVFRNTDEQPWTLVAGIGDACLLRKGVSCRSCTDMCDERALRFDLRAGPVGAIEVNAASCTGCGACVSTCPTDAITLEPISTREFAA